MSYFVGYFVKWMIKHRAAPRRNVEDVMADGWENATSSCLVRECIGMVWYGNCVRMSLVYVTSGEVSIGGLR